MCPRLRSEAKKVPKLSFYLNYHKFSSRVGFGVDIFSRLLLFGIDFRFSRVYSTENHDVVPLLLEFGKSSSHGRFMLSWNTRKSLSNIGKYCKVVY